MSAKPHSQVEAANLLRSEERFRLLVESVRDSAIFMLDPQGHVLTWNAGAERFKGYRAEEIVGQRSALRPGGGLVVGTVPAPARARAGDRVKV
jgi:PAS domain-containing protein